MAGDEEGVRVEIDIHEFLQTVSASVLARACLEGVGERSAFAREVANSVFLEEFLTDLFDIAPPMSASRLADALDDLGTVLNSEGFAGKDLDTLFSAVFLMIILLTEKLSERDWQISIKGLVSDSEKRRANFLEAVRRFLTPLKLKLGANGELSLLFPD